MSARFFTVAYQDRLRQFHDYYLVNCPGIRTMDISLLHDDETENEIELNLCCHLCAEQKFGWSVETFNRILHAAQSNQPFKVPANVRTASDFIHHFTK